MAKFLTVSELRMDDLVIPLTTDPKHRSGMTFMVTDLHPVLLGNYDTGEYKTVAVTLWDGNREFTSRTMLYELIERRWNN